MTLYPADALIHVLPSEEAREAEIERIARVICANMEGAEYCDCEVATWCTLLKSASGKWILPSPEARVKLWQTYYDAAVAIYELSHGK